MVVPRSHLREEYFDALLYGERIVVEHAFAWMDAYKTLLCRFETLARNWYHLNMLAMTIIFIKKNYFRQIP